MIRISTILLAATIAVSAASSASAQAFSSGSGTGNVLPTHYDTNGRLVRGFVQDRTPQTRATVIDREHSAFAAAPAPSANAFASGSPGYNELLATH